MGCVWDRGSGGGGQWEAKKKESLQNGQTEMCSTRVEGRSSRRHSTQPRRAHGNVNLYVQHAACDRLRCAHARGCGSCARHKSIHTKRARRSLARSHLLRAPPAPNSRPTSARHTPIAGMAGTSASLSSYPISASLAGSSIAAAAADGRGLAVVATQSSPAPPTTICILLTPPSGPVVAGPSSCIMPVPMAYGHSA